ncbi:hypothetical protein [Flavobacterium sp.]|jgi:hypothetical protein|uniref:hypothetical protein n=1 Tax=Flavobacterium sp. TaxID=239 RepID=UPI0037BE365C
MSDLTRKDFLRLSSWGLVATLLPISQINALSSILKNEDSPKNDDYLKAKELAKEAKVFFYKKNFKKAEELYLECIKLAPNAIRFYDNLENVYGANLDLLSSVELFKNGLLVNIKNPAFYDRAARSLMRLELGNTKHAEMYKNKISSVSLLNDAKDLITKAIALNASKKYLTVSLATIQKKEARNRIRDEKERLVLIKEERKNNRIQFKKTFKAKSESEIITLLEKVATKKRVTLYHVKEIDHQNKQISKQKRRYNQILLSKLDSKNPEREKLVETIFNLDPSNSSSLHQIKKEYYKNNRYADFIAVRQQFADKKQTLFSNLGLMDAIEKAYLEKQVSFESLEKAVTIGKELFENWPLLEDKKVDVANKLSKIYILQQRFDEAKLVLVKTINTCSTSTPAVVNKLLYSYASVFLAEQNFEKANQVLQIAINNDEEIKNESLKEVLKLAKNKKPEAFKDKLSLYYLLYKVYKASNMNQESILILETLQRNNPNDQFVLTRK